MKRKGATAAVLLGVPSVLIGLAGILGASPAFADCSGSTFCLYQTASYQGTQYSYHPTTSCLNLSGGANNNANAMRNYNSFYVKLWDFPGCGGGLAYTAKPNSYDSDLGHNSGNPAFSNKASSLNRI